MRVSRANRGGSDPNMAAATSKPKQQRLKEQAAFRKRLDEIKTVALRQGYITEDQIVFLLDEESDPEQQVDQMEDIHGMLKLLKEGQLKIEDFIKVAEEAATEQALKKERQRAVRILERVFVLQKRYNDQGEKQNARMAEKQRHNFHANFAKIEAELTQELHKLSINPRTVEGLAAPVKQVAERAIESED